MPDRTFASWLFQHWPRAVFMVLTFALVWFFLMMGVASSLHQSHAVDLMGGEHTQIIAEAARAKAEAMHAKEEAVKTRRAVERLETRLDAIGEGTW